MNFFMLILTACIYNNRKKNSKIMNNTFIEFQDEILKLLKLYVERKV